MKCREGVSKAGVKGKGSVHRVNVHTQFGVFSNTFLKKVSFALKDDCFHPFEQVYNIEVTVTAKAKEELVSAGFDVVAHHSGIHSNQFDREGIDDKFHLNCNRAANDLHNSGFWEPVNKFRVKETSKVTVKPLVSADQFVDEA